MKTDSYRQTLRGLPDWDGFLMAESGLPGPRANLELLQAVADEGSAERFARYLANDAGPAAPNTPQEYLLLCGVIGQGKLLAEGDHGALDRLRAHASDPRWRVREVVAMALQRTGDRDMAALLQDMEAWSQGSVLEQRAAAAALCEPRLLKERSHAERTLQLLDQITESLSRQTDRKGEGFQALRKGLAYCWSVAVAAAPDAGKRAMERWLRDSNPDLRWIMKENLRKNRLERMDAAWVARWKAELGMR